MGLGQELLRLIHLQPLDRQVGGWDWGGKQGAWGTEFQEVPAPEVQVQSQHPTVRGFLILHTLGATFSEREQWAQRQKQWVLILVPSLHGLHMSLNLAELMLGIHKDKLRWIHEHTSS